MQKLFPEIETRTIQTFEDGDDSATDEQSVAQAQLVPLVHDNSFQTELDRLIAAVGRRLSASS